jgi:hypothetical protein
MRFVSLLRLPCLAVPYASSSRMFFRNLALSFVVAHCLLLPSIGQTNHAVSSLYCSHRLTLIGCIVISAVLGDRWRTGKFLQPLDFSSRNQRHRDIRFRRTVSHFMLDIQLSILKFRTSQISYCHTIQSREPMRPTSWRI